jgi:RNA polymerase sigma-70 factor, ECF subfamily
MADLVVVETPWDTAAQDVVRDPLEFEAFFAAQQDRLFRSLCLITGSRHEAEDITQETFAKVWERWDQVASMDDPAGYLHRAAMNTFRSRYRRAKVALRRTIGVLPLPDVLEAVEARHEVHAAFRSLTPRQRAALVLTEVLGYPAEEAGRLLGVRASTVRALRTQARAALRRRREATT